MKWFKGIWAVVAIINIVCFVAMITRHTDHFQSRLYFDGVILAIFVGIPSLGLLIMSIGGIFLRKEGASGLSGYIAGSIIMFLLLLLSRAYFATFS
ncbi:hypothetical protein ACFSGI_17910 [Paenibacillus nicotianae]|uniref:YesK-like protein n=1 Tax=Paenibacillus nicotianae TaxID=1526551 RepID=A0ABW4UXX0_9BACL